MILIPKIKPVCTFLLLILGSNAFFAQTPAPACNCCTPAYHQFDFWLGDWDVYNQKGEKVGENRILSMQDSCIIQENWVSEGQTGTSYNFYNQKDSTWNQTYIDNTGTVLELKGRLEHQKMVLKGPLIKSKKGDYNVFNRIIWAKDSAGNVSQKWDIVKESGEIVFVAFDGIYKRMKPSVITANAQKVTGIGGIFFKSKNPKTLREWYKTHLGLNTDGYGTSFEWREGADSSKYGFTQWSPFSEKTTYFAPSEKEFMINYRVNNLEALIEELKKAGVTITDTMESYDYGKFIHIMDCEGNKIELWEPSDEEYNKIVKGRTK